MNARLRQAAEVGDTNALYECIRQDPNVLNGFDEVEFVDNPLHIAAAGGHAAFAIAIFNLKPSFARKLNHDVYSPIHLALQNDHHHFALQNDHHKTVLRLLEADRDLVRVKGKEGYTVLHQAAKGGNLQLLAEFIKHCPAGMEDVTIRNETALHIAAKNCQLEALELLARWFQRTHIYCKVSRKHLLNSKDSDGNTVLHIAAYPIQPQMIKILVECGANGKATNINGETALDIIQNQWNDTYDRDISLKILQGFMNGIKPRGIKPLQELLRSKVSFFERLIMGSTLSLSNLSAERVSAILVVIALILTATFQAVNNPPGGVWQGDGSKATSNGRENNFVGSSIMDPLDYKIFVVLNFSIFTVATIFTIVLLESVGVGSCIMTLVQILLSLFVCCFLFTVLFINPSNVIQINLFRALGPFFYALIIMDIGRRMLRRLPLRYENLKNCFREM